jgi:mRNA interferase MazF
MTNFDSGDIVLVHFPFTDLTSTKQRPAIILNRIEFSRQYSDFVLMPLTGQSQPNSGLELLDWKTSGLLRRTWAKPIIATVHTRLIIKVIGAISALDERVVRAAFQSIFGERWLERNP